MGKLTYFLIALPVLLQLPLTQLQEWSTKQENCYHLNNCNSNSNRPTCHCDDECFYFGDCCPNKIYGGSQFLHPKVSSVHCLEGSLVIAGCSDAWTGDRIVKEKCHSLGSWDDPLSLVPAASKRLGFSYRNFYCARCNGEDIDNLVLWNVIMESNGALAQLIQNDQNFNLSKKLTKRNDQWGIFFKKHGLDYFHPLFFTFNAPQNISARPCIPELIDSCPKDTILNDIAQKCRQYSSPIYSRNAGYKNVHCALCNEDSKGLLCRDINKNFTSSKNTRKIRFRTRLATVNGIFYLSLCCPTFMMSTSAMHQFNQDSLSNTSQIRRKHSLQNSDQEEGPNESFKSCVKVPFYPGEYLVNENSTIIITEFNAIINNSFFHPMEDGSVYVCAEKLSREVTRIVRRENFSMTYRNCHKSYFPPEAYTILPNNSALLKEFNFTFNEYLILNNKLCVCFFFEKPNQGNTSEDDIYEFLHEHFRECVKFYLGEEDYEVVNDSMVFVEKYGIYHNKSWYLIDEETNELLICIPEHISKDDAYDEVFFKQYQVVLTVVCIGISIICLVLHLIAFFLVADMRNLAGMNLASLCAALLLSYTLFLCITDVENYSFCVVLASIMIYSLLASFFWMNTISFDVWRTLYLATKSLRLVTEEEKWRRYRRYSYYSWISPLIIVLVCLCFELIPGDNLGLRPEISLKLCWFRNKNSLLVFFVLPFVALNAASIVLFIYSTIIVFKSSANSTKSQCPPPKRNYKLYLKLAILTGMTWFTGILGFLLRHEVVWVIFIILNTLQGLFIFIGFTYANKTVNHKVRTFWKKRSSKKSISEASGVSTVMTTMTQRPSTQC